MKVSEAEEQEALFQWAAMQSGKYPELALLFHVPNGGKRDIITAAKLKKQGVKSGVPDLFLPVPRGNFHGLFVELKIAGGKLSLNQSVFLDRLHNQGYACSVCYGWINAAAVILNYLKIT